MDFFPPFTIPGEGISDKLSCEVLLHCMDLKRTCHRYRVDNEEGNNGDVRLYTGVFKYTGQARTGDLAAISRIGEAEYELRIIPQSGQHFAALQGFATTPIGHAGKRYGYITNAQLAGIINESVPDPARTAQFDEYHPRQRT